MAGNPITSSISKLVEDAVKDAVEKVAEKAAKKVAPKAARRAAPAAASPLAVRPATAVVSPQIMRHADPALKILQTRAAELAVPVKQRLKPSGYQVFDTSPEAYRRTMSIVPQSRNEDVLSALPRLPAGDNSPYPKNDRMAPLIERREDIARLMADDIRDVPEDSISSNFYMTGPMYEGLAETGGLGTKGAFDFMQNRFAPAFAGTSPRTPTVQNARNASLLLYLDKQGVPLPGLLEHYGSTPGYNIIGEQHPGLTDRMLRGTHNLHQNPKPGEFGGAVAGDQFRNPVDTHNIRSMLLAYNRLFPGEIPPAWLFPHARERYASEGLFNPAKDVDDSLASASRRGVKAQVEYGPLADINARVGELAGRPTAVGQSDNWFINGPETGLKSPELTVVDLMNDRFDLAGQALGIPPEDTLGMFANSDIPLFAKGGRVSAFAVRH
jgi:hypothetical protein